MLRSFINIIHKKFNGRILFLSLLLFFLFMTFVLPNEASRSATYYGDTPTPDTSLIYSSDDLYEMVGGFGEDGRAYYIRSRFTFDIVWPLTYGFFLWSWIFYLSRPLRPTAHKGLSLLPLAGVSLDFLENIGASIVVFFYPVTLPLLPNLVPLFTFGKWILIGVSFFVLIILLVHRRDDLWKRLIHYKSW